MRLTRRVQNDWGRLTQESDSCEAPEILSGAGEKGEDCPDHDGAGVEGSQWKPLHQQASRPLGNEVAKVEDGANP